MNFMTVISHGWTAFSFVATIVGAGAVGLIVLGLIAAAYLPSWLRHLIVGSGIGILLGAVLFQAGQAKGSHDAFAVEAARTLKVEKDRAEALVREQQRQAAASARISAQDKARADAAEAASKASASRLRDLQRHLARTPDGTCVSPDDARRLRAL
ncbi:hypothetical protein [uncultured Methylobacterium sp.]|uniref:hypothetical protein n=1 Tax=uncultured Methylobacterium sp. TaxID=157278 RepID=UPI0035CA3091